MPAYLEWLRYMHRLDLEAESDSHGNEDAQSRAEDVEKFMKDLAAAASSGTPNSLNSRD